MIIKSWDLMARMKLFEIIKSILTESLEANDHRSPEIKKILIEHSLEDSE
jgi:hypothetical protein